MSTPLKSNTVAAPYNSMSPGVKNADNTPNYELLEPQHYGEIKRMYGPLLDLYEWLRLSGAIGTMSNEELIMIMEGSIERSIVLGPGGISTSVASADISFQLDASNYDTRGNCYPTVGEAILIPIQYLGYTGGTITEKSYRISTISGSAGAYTIHAEPMDAKTFIAVAIPEFTELSTGVASYGYGTDQPQGKSSYDFIRKFRTALLKETIVMQGGAGASRMWEEGLKGGYDSPMTRARMQAQFLLNIKKDRLIAFGEENTNNLTEKVMLDTPPFTTATSPAIIGTMGI